MKKPSGGKRRSPAASRARRAARSDGDDRYRALFDYSPIGLGVADMQGNLLAFNDAMLQPGGYSREEVERLGNVATLYCHPEDREEILRQARAQGYVWRHPVQFRRRDGSCYDTLLTLTPVEFDGKPCWHAMVEDITARKAEEAERRRLEGQLRQAQKMEAVGQMTAGIAHDFNNVLSIILANAELVTATLAPDAGAVAGDLAELRAAAERGAAMIRKLLAFSRRTPLAVEPTDLCALVRDLNGILRHAIPERIALEITTTPDGTALVDPGAVEQMLVNLATNGRDAIRGSGRIYIDVAPTVVTAESHADRIPVGAFVCVRVRDDGVGMDEATRLRALEPFFSTKAAHVGTGLGLPMVYGLIKQQRGFIDIASAPGRGTTVTLYFPPAAVPAVPRIPRSSIAPGAAPLRATILLLEDNEELRRTCQRVLEHLGYRVLAAANGREGLAVYRAHRAEINLVVSDVVMPEMTGPEAYEAVTRDDPRMPFLFLSGYEEREIRAAAVPPGVPLLRKPWTIDELAQHVREALQP